MRKVEVNIYKFDELENDIKEKIVSEWNNEESGLLNSWVESETDYLKSLYGFNDLEIHYSLSYSQGDGVCIEFKNTMLSEFKYNNKFNEKTNHLSDIADLILNFVNEIHDLHFLNKEQKKEIISDMKQTGIKSVRYNHNYSHYNSVKCETVEFYEYPYYENNIQDFTPEDKEILMCIIDNFCENLEIEFTYIIRNLSVILETSGYKELEYLDSEEHIKEIIELNEYEFYSNGDLV